MRDFSTMDADARISDAVAQRSSEIRRSIEGRIAVFKQVTVDLSVAQDVSMPYKVGLPFRSVFVRRATDSTAVLYLAPNENSIGNMEEAMDFYKNDSFDFGLMLSAAYLWWPAQAGKSMTLFLSTEGRMQAGSQISQIAGGLSVSDGSSINSAALASTGDQAKVTITAATMILPTDADRKKATLYIDGPCWGGDANVAVGARGTLFPAGQVVVANTGPFYLVPVGASVNVYGNVEK